jgi:enamine deaminase RidA (YjgF/YER057c/UK114 family)/catechol 2,3-dioxygenase-like lactoylglutathione lyase family enzyme
MQVESRLTELGIALPAPPAAVAAYSPWLRTGNLVVTSGQLPWRGGKLAYTGKLGDQLDESQGYEAARLCAINAIAQLKAAVGDLERIVRIVRLEGNVHSARGFRGHPQVLNGASDLFNEVFGERGRHTRTALGISEMPLDAPVQLSVWAEVSETRLPGKLAGKSKIAHFTIATRDIKGSAEFFRRTLGWNAINRPGNIDQPAAWLAISEDQELHLIEVADFEASPFEREFGRHFAISYPLHEFDALKSRLVQHGAQIIPPERQTPFERFFFRDPNGYIFEIIEADHQRET